MVKGVEFTKEYIVKEANEKHISFQDAINQLDVKGCILEFGVASGTSIRDIARMQPDRKIYGFDTFEGLPEDWRGGNSDWLMAKGTFACDVPVFEETNINIVKGLFADTLPDFLSSLDEPIALIHIDCDLYSSTKTVFDILNKQVQIGTRIMFDEILGPYGNDEVWEVNEFKAFAEYLREAEIEVEMLGAYGSEKIAFVVTKI